ncbi:hypothetical protein ACFOYW_00350 [Gryllotalpicola reticulitermitis]|uniref:Uncharacterized protein n=1 Tax=Gryllotalpicola reticulitermitis TaxID=1184153 RepID=A0ABV8Q2T8_9MICO
MARGLDDAVDAAAWAVERAIDADFARLEDLAVPAREVERLVSALERVDARPIAQLRDPLLLFPALGAAVDSAMPWQPPFVTDAILDLPAVQDALTSIAAAALASEAAAWWTTGCDLSSQWAARPIRDGKPALLSSGTASNEILASWSDYFAAEENRFSQRRMRNVSGTWWSTPHAHGGVQGQWAKLPSTTRRLGGLGAVALALQEDSWGDTEALLNPVLPAPGVRVYEVHGPEDLSRLVQKYPAPARWSRQYVWRQSTGMELDWAVPDYAAAAEDFDAIHLSVIGYLSTAGSAVPFPHGGGTVLAGWAPDETYWLTDHIEIHGPAEHWYRQDGDEMHQWRQRT